LPDALPIWILRRERVRHLRTTGSRTESSFTDLVVHRECGLKVALARANLEVVATAERDLTREERHRVRTATRRVVEAPRTAVQVTTAASPERSEGRVRGHDPSGPTARRREAPRRIEVG